jgi:hypothetical protein
MSSSLDIPSITFHELSLSAGNGKSELQRWSWVFHTVSENAFYQEIGGRVRERLGDWIGFVCGTDSRG